MSHGTVSWLWVVLTGMGVGFLSGLFGKGGSPPSTTSRSGVSARGSSIGRSQS